MDTARAHWWRPPSPGTRRTDAEDRAELCRGSVEYVATPEYSVRPPMAPAHLFVMDASAPAVASGALATACAAVARCLDDLPSESALGG